MKSLFLVALLLVTASSAQLLSPPDTSAASSQSSSPSQTPTTTSPTTTAQSTAQSTSTTSSSPTQTSLTTTSTTAPPSVTPPIGISTSNGVPFTPTATGSSSSSAPSTSSTSPPSNTGGTSLGTGSIIGISVAGGIAVIGILAFVFWKLTRKRFSDFDDNEAIKWPELNSHGNNDSHPLPVHTTGRAGFETGSEASLSRVNSSTYSTPDFASGAGSDLYAVPPLPHLNPNQPYRDDPSGPTGYYDPYAGPVPGTLENGGSEWSGEAIPMTQMNPGARMTPPPPANFVYDGGRQSPVPHMAYQGRASPRPQIPYAGQTSSSGPQAAYGGVNYDAYHGGR